MQKQFFFLSPVEVVKVTSQNLAEVAEWCGGSVQETESRRVQGRMDKYVLVPTPSEKQISWAFPGMFITKRLVVTVKDELRATYAVFRRDYFEKNYFDTPADATDKTWERQEAEKNKPKPKKPAKKKPYVDMHLTQNMGEALLKAQQKAKEALAELEALEQIDAVVEDRSEELAASMEETQEALKALGAEIIEVIPVEIPEEEFLTFTHEHTYTKSCDSQLCSVDRYQDGKHIFKDAIGFAKDSETPTVWTDHNGNVIPAPEQALEGKSESQLEMHFSNGVNHDVDVMGSLQVGYENLRGL